MVRWVRQISSDGNYEYALAAKCWLSVEKGEGCRVAGQSQLGSGSLAHEGDRAEGRVVFYSRDCLYGGELVLAIKLLEEKKENLGWAFVMCLVQKRLKTDCCREGRCRCNLS